MTRLLSSLLFRNELIDHRGFEVITVQNHLIITLQKASKSGIAVGIYANVLGNGMFVTGIEGIEERDGEQMILLKSHDVMGSKLIRNTISLSDIKAICVFDMPYKCPSDGIEVDNGPITKDSLLEKILKSFPN